jgi:hypothetical protein
MPPLDYHNRMLPSQPRPGASPLPVPPRRKATSFQVPQPSPAPVSITPVQATSQMDVSPVRRISFYAGLGVIFTFMAVLSEILYSILHFNTYVLYIVGPIAVFGAVITGGIGRSFRSRAPYFLLAVFIWMVIGTPFSSWRTVSMNRVMDFGRFGLMVFLVTGGLVVNWKEIRLVFYTIASAGGVVLLYSRFFADSVGGRVTLDVTGSIGNSNDLASHVLFVLPFLMFVSMDPRRNPLLRFAVWGPILFGIWVALGTASRGGLLGLIGALVYMLFKGNMRQRLALIVGVPILAVILAGALPQEAMIRLGSLFGEEPPGARQLEALESQESRSYLFKKSVQYTLEHPLLGIGVDTFPTYEGGEARRKGEHGNWHVSHCAWTQISSDCGIPGLIFYICAWGSSILLVNRTHGIARKQGNKEVVSACFCYLLSATGFLISITFLANAYRMYFPLMVGLAVSLHFAAMREMGLSEASPTSPQETRTNQPFPRASFPLAGPVPARVR